MAQPKSPREVIEAVRPKLPAGVKADLHCGSCRLRAYAGVSPVTGKAEHLQARAPLSAQPRDLVELALSLAARAVELKAARRHRRKEGGHAPLPVPTAGAATDRTCRAAFELWWKVKGQHLASAAKHRGNLDSYLLPTMGDVFLWRLRDAVDDEEAERDPDLFDMSVFYARLAKSGAVGRGRADANGNRRGAGAPLAPATLESVHGTARAALNHVARKGWLPNGNPLAGMGMAAGGGRADTLPLEEEMAALVPWLAADRLEVAVAALFVGNGPRPTEAAAVRWHHLDLDAGRLTLRGEGIVRVGKRGEPERWELRDDPTDKRRPRPVTLPPLLVDLLCHLWLDRRERALLCGVTLSRRAFVLSDTPDGMDHMTPHSIGTAFSRSLERARKSGLTVPAGMTLYDMRHYGITHALRSRVSVAEAARRFGTSKRMINERYDHAVPGEDEIAAVAMGSVWGIDLCPGTAEVIPLDCPRLGA